ncbi:MAG: methylmalonyl-CoA mutase family protein [Acidobacteria bacterium]|nr:methylmalonyl-CoA mutase family protein [Acidobacteriota bacterium]MBU4404065.1 methylmalonyl-CoA mutase family protein [Acidobacteriota bacterium]MCG2811217.1 methylmalonyl-CoA mutase family protein [Candidatus Aminicenantes bacterium]
MKKNEWEEGILKRTLEKSKERKENFKATSFPVQRLYDPGDVSELDYEKDLGYPGAFPYTRGVQPTMYRGKFWTMRQYAGFGSAEESNRRYRYLLEQGQTGLSVAFDLPTQIGLDSDNTLCEGEVGKVGVAIDTLEDMEILFAEIPLDKVSVSMTINASAAIILAMYLAVAEKRGIAFDRLLGTIQNDLLKEYIARGTYIYPPKPSLRIISNIFSFCKERVPKWNTISISGYHIREAGSTAAQELAFTFADAIEYVKSALASGLQVDEFAPRLSFFFASHNNLLEEVAKFRAARRIWARIMKNKFAAGDKSQLMRFHTQTGGVTLTAQQPTNNVVRVTLQALAAVLGGTQSLHTNSMDEALALPSEDSVRVALRTQQIIAYESGVADTIDPLAGSYYVEALTNEIEKEVWKYLDKIEAMGGMLAAIEAGYPQQQIQDSSYSYQKEIDSGEQVIVGVNQFQVQEDLSHLKTLKVSPEGEELQKNRLLKIKKERDAAAVQTALAKVKAAAAGSGNLMPPILEAVKVYATLQEIADQMRAVFGEYKEKIVI